MSDEPRPRTRGQTSAALLRKLARNPLHPSPEKITASEIVDLEEPSSRKSRRSKSSGKSKQMTIDEIFTDPREDGNCTVENLSQGNDMQELSDAENHGETVADSEEDETELMEQDQEQVAEDSEEEETEYAEEDEHTEEDEEPCFVYEPLESRIESLRSQHLATVAATASLRRLKRRHLSDTFRSAAASTRYEHLTSRTVLVQKYLPENDPELLEARAIIEKAQLMYTVLDVPSYIKEVVLEFYANLKNMIKRGGTTWVYVRSHMYEFSPSVINTIFKTPSQDVDSPRKPWTNENLDDAVVTVTGGKKKKWGNLRMLDVTPTMNILFKFCVFNWIPTANRSL